MKPKPNSWIRKINRRSWLMSPSITICIEISRSSRPNLSTLEQNADVIVTPWFIIVIIQEIKIRWLTCLEVVPTTFPFNLYTMISCTENRQPEKPNDLAGFGLSQQSKKVIFEESGPRSSSCKICVAVTEEDCADYG